MWQKLKTILVLTAWVMAAFHVVATYGCANVEDASSLDLSGAEGERSEPVTRFNFDEASAAWDRRMAELEEESEERTKRLLAEEALRPPPPKRRVREVRRFVWRSPAAARGETWNVPEDESDQAVLTAFLRICIAESGGDLQDCVGIWQVFNNIRQRSCERGRIRRITECDENGETMLSVMRRAQPHAMGMMPLQTRRAAWIRNLETSCDPPEGFPGSENQWDGAYGQRCQHTVQLGRVLMAGGDLPQRPGERLRWLPNRPITWGGRCERAGGACDDAIACARGLSRIPDTGTLNAFWCHPGSRGCPADIDPVCQQYRGEDPTPSAPVVTRTEPEKTVRGPHS